MNGPTPDWLVRKRLRRRAKLRRIVLRARASRVSPRAENPPTRDMHTCHVPRCHVMVSRRHLLCPYHWLQVPKRLRKRLNDAYLPGQERPGQEPSSRYLALAGAAVAVASFAPGEAMAEGLRRAEQVRETVTSLALGQESEPAASSAVYLSPPATRALCACCGAVGGSDWATRGWALLMLYVPMPAARERTGYLCGSCQRALETAWVHWQGRSAS